MTEVFEQKEASKFILSQPVIGFNRSAMPLVDDGPLLEEINFRA